MNNFKRQKEWGQWRNPEVGKIRRKEQKVDLPAEGYK